MIYYIFYEWLYNRYEGGGSYLVKALNVFQYVTFRTAYASITALLISLVFGGRVIQLLKNWNVGQQIREEGPQAHIAKRGTPTMGGVLIIASVIISTLLWARLSSLYVWIVMLAMLLFGTIGFLDDYRKMALRRSLGLTGKQKLAGQFLIAVGVWAILYFTSVSVGGPPMLRVGELRDSSSLSIKLRDKRDPLSEYVASQLSPEMQQTLKVYDGTSPLPEADQRRLIDELNGLLRGPSLYDEQRFAQVRLTDEAQKFIKLNPQGENLIRLNRVLLEEAYSAEIARTTKYSWNVNIPFFKATSDQNPLTSVSYIGPYLYLIFIIIVLLGSSNAVNLTDGLDGLAISITFVAMAALTAFTYITSDYRFAGYLGLVHRPEAAELTVFCGALAGASLGFLWYNAPPAEVFMGDVGSLAIGGAIGTIAVLTKQEFILLMVGGIFVIEILSVMIQVASFKMTGRRVFKMSPIHHHFEIQWERRFGQRTVETKVVFRFLILAILFALLSLSTLKLR
ncbi:MAG: phospho-N-acetylmuramoyl-pentapeptide-transferase [Acidobacteriota bacterium]|jgi:UDP-N-acetylmuramyl pentapeptide phosphotransferase/UDP-N-acetylglucosamine-1-phosphate transferase|nr:phospho-N-acetylmuramoyl-pentapeptide-transferase [Acidobacteriota bacterium]